MEIGYHFTDVLEVFSSVRKRVSLKIVLWNLSRLFLTGLSCLRLMGLQDYGEGIKALKKRRKYVYFFLYKMALAALCTLITSFHPTFCSEYYDAEGLDGAKGKPPGDE
jgi:hypothetical protein